MILAGTQKMTLGDSGMGEEGKGSGGGEDAETRTSGPDSGSEHNGRGNSVTGEVVKGVHYPLGTECCDDLEWDDPDFDHTRPRPIIRPSYHVRIPGVTDSLGTEGPDDVEWDDDNFKIDARRSAPAISNSTARRVIYDNQYQCVCEVGRVQNTNRPRLVEGYSTLHETTKQQLEGTDCRKYPVTSVL